MTNARFQYREISRRIRRADVPFNGADAWAIICQVRGCDPRNPWSDRWALRLQSLFNANASVEDAVPLAPRIARLILNNFGTTNPFRCLTRKQQERGNRHRSLAYRMRERGMLDIEPGNYVALKGFSPYMERAA